MARRRLTHRGFTLIEVLVAMTIIAVGVTALVQASGSASWRANFLREREFARWVASNHLTEVQVLPAWPEIGAKNTEVDMMGLRWYIRTRTKKVEDPDLRRVDVEARLDKDEDSYLYSVTGFVGNPQHRVQ
ncbi:MAG: type II secretion system minor pseudopilin GspI [Gammaproteobacteria bacterium]|nr:type II secretion system minor pseudopilin GspI [Gammaproteobacteria bacterium]